MKGMEGRPLSKKEQGLSMLRSAVAALAALTAGDAAMRPEAPAYEQGVRSEAHERANGLLSYYAEHPEAVSEGDMDALAQAMRETNDRTLVLDVFYALAMHARAAGSDEQALWYDRMTTLEEAGNVRAAESIFLHRSRFLAEGEKDKAQEEREWYTEFLQNDPSVDTAHLEDAFRILRTHAELGSLEERAHLAHLVSRELQYGGYRSDTAAPLTEAMVLDTLENLEKNQEQYGNLPVFNETIIALYANQKNGNDAYLYGSRAEHTLLQTLGTLHEYRPPQGQTNESLHRSTAFQATFEAIQNSPTPITLFVNAHGGPDGLYLDQSQTSSNGDAPPTIATEALAEAFIARYEQHPELAAQARVRPDSIVLDNCFAGSIATRIYAALSARGLPVPTIVGSSEEGQLGYGSVGSTYRFPSQLLERLFPEGGIRTARPTLDDLVAIDRMARPFGTQTAPLGDFVVRPARTTEGKKTERNMQLSENEQRATASV